MASYWVTSPNFKGGYYVIYGICSVIPVHSTSDPKGF